MYLRHTTRCSFGTPGLALASAQRVPVFGGCALPSAWQFGMGRGSGVGAAAPRERAWLAGSCCFAKYRSSDIVPPLLRAYTPTHQPSSVPLPLPMPQDASCVSVAESARTIGL